MSSSRSASPSSKTEININELSYDQLSNIDLTLMMLRKPTELKKLLDSIPKPSRAVPKNGLPFWYRLGLENKLPIPEIPAGKIIFSRGKLGENVRHLGLGSGPRPSFDLTDPYCHYINYDYVPLHDPYLKHYFSQKQAKKRMEKSGFSTKDNRAVCSLKEFNDYRKFLYSRFQDRVHMELKRLDEELHDTILLKRVEADVSRRKRVFERREKARLHFEKVAREHADEIEEKKQRAKEREKKNAARVAYLEEFQEKQRKERIAKGRERSNRIRQRVQAANEIELRRKITMVRDWRRKEKARCARLKREKEEKIKRREQEINERWARRVEVQNYKIQKELTLLKIYTHNMDALISKRAKRAQLNAYNYDLQLQKLKLANSKAAHGGSEKYKRLVKKMGVEFEKCKRGTKGMSPEYAHELAVDAMKASFSTSGDPLMMLTQARAKMDILTALPTAPTHLLNEMIETAVMVFARRRVNLLLRNVECKVHSDVYLTYVSPTPIVNKPVKVQRWLPLDKVEAVKLIPEERVPTGNITFGPVERHNPEFEPDKPMKRILGRRPTPVPSLMVLAQAAFADQIKDLPDPVEKCGDLPERTKLIIQSQLAKKILMKSVMDRVIEGLDVCIGEVTLPPMRKRMEWGEAVEAMSGAVVNNRISATCPDIVRATEFLAFRILRVLLMEMKEDKFKMKKLVPPKRSEILDELAKDIVSENMMAPPKKEVRRRKRKKVIINETEQLSRRELRENTY